MKTLVIILALFVISCRPIQVTVECPHQNGWGGLGEIPSIEWPPENQYLPYHQQQEPGYIYIDGEKMPIATIPNLNSIEAIDYTLPEDHVFYMLTPD